jgi:hypothetical protein
VLAELAGDSLGQEVVDGISLPTLFDRQGLGECHFLKLDCEGAEFEILYRLPQAWYPRIARLAIEYHVKRGEAKSQQAGRLVEHLQNAGYRIDLYTDVLGTNRGMIYARRL